MIASSMGRALVLGLVGVSGCVAAGIAAGPVMGALQAISDRSIERTVPADLSTAARATSDALSRTGIRVTVRERGETSWTARGAGGAVTVDATLTEVTTQLTRVSLRVESGRISADKGTAEEILNQIAQSLSPRPEAVREPSNRGDDGTAAIATLEAEVRRLRLEMEKERNTPPRPVAEPEPVAQPRIREGAVVSIPESSGLPTPAKASAAAPALAKPAPAPSGSAPSASGHARKERPDVVPPRPYTPVVEPGGTLAGPLAPVNVLTPIQPMTGLGTQN